MCESVRAREREKEGEHRHTRRRSKSIQSVEFVAAPELFKFNWTSPKLLRVLRMAGKSGDVGKMLRYYASSANPAYSDKRK